MAADWFPYSVEVWDPPFKMDSPRKTVEYKPLDKASKPWEICVSFPHMKDAYWLAVDYGVADGRRGPQALRVLVVDAPPSVVAATRRPATRTGRSCRPA